MAYYKRFGYRGRGRKINGSRNSGETHCRWCGRSLLPQQGLTWVDPGGYEHAKCADGCNKPLPAVFVAPQASVTLDRVAKVDVLSQDGTVSVGYLLSDGSIAKLR